MDGAASVAFNRCHKRVSEELTYRRCVLDAGHSVPCIGEPDWMTFHWRRFDRAQEIIAALTHPYDRNAKDDDTCAVCGRGPEHPKHWALAATGAESQPDVVAVDPHAEAQD
jgi:hypothetical protein